MGLSATNTDETLMHTWDEHIETFRRRGSESETVCDFEPVITNHH